MNDDLVRFFWERWKRGVQMGGRYEWDAVEWVDAYKATLSNSQKQKFEKIWDKYSKELEDYHNAPPKRQKNMNPMRIEK